MSLKIVMPKLTAYDKNEWIAYRNEHSIISWDDILASGFDAVKCDCGKNGCLGWRLARVPAQRPLFPAPVPPNSPRAA